MEILIVILVILAVLVVAVIAIYNNLVKLKNRVGNAWTQISVQLQRRLDLIPNLVETVKGYAAHERGTLEAVTQARAAVMNAATPDEQQAADNFLSGTLKSLFAVAEQYPDLKANQNFLQLQGEIADIENKLAAARRFFNSATKELNNGVQRFPAVLFANMFGFHTEPMFEVPATERAQYDKAPEIKF